MLDTIAKNATVIKTRPAQRTGMERKALQWIRKFDNAQIADYAGQLYITDSYRMHKVPAQYAAILGLVPGRVENTCLTYEKSAITIANTGRVLCAEDIKKVIDASNNIAELIPQSEQLSDGIARFILGDEIVLINAKYLTDAAYDGAIKLTGAGYNKPVHAFDADGILVAVIMPRNR